MKNNRQVSLLQICGILMGKLIFNSVFNFIDTRNMLSVHQSGFRPSDSCVVRLISIVHDVYNAFDANLSLEVRSIFLDLSKTFDRVWHKGLLHKLKCMGIDGNFLTLVQSFLSDRYRRVVLNGRASSWADVKAGAPRGSILLLFLFTSMIYLEICNQLSNFLQTIHQYFMLLRTPIHSLKF